ncbi:hypothetical protein ACEZCY_35950 [Streptacidiphilus sp. N1-12]|uniref:Uncharacterized protein n=1 Tax=Streptacidiphilus alkalitolerans TaxID=3342712 RepID=A0ABV6WRB0_9ACTN
MSTSTPPPAWRRKREVKRRTVAQQRRADHAAKIRAKGAESGPKGSAQAEWDLLRATIGRLPDAVRDGEWMQITQALRTLSTRLEERHST